MAANVNVAAAAAAAAPVVAAPAVQLAGFALSPARAVAGVIDMSSSAGSKLFNKGAEALSISLSKDERGYDGKGANLKLLLTYVKQRANVFDWTGILTFTIDGVARNLLVDYGQIPIADMKTQVTTYIAQPNRNAQNSFMMFECLSKSLTVEALNSVLTEVTDYTVNDIPSGPLFLKVIIRKAYIDTRATTAHVRTSLSCLDSYILTINCDIKLFHDYVRGLRNDLAARGEVTNDLMFNLFKGYNSVTDIEFKQYIKQKKSAYEDGTLDLEEDQLMMVAENKFDALVQAGDWNQPTREQEQIIALTTTIQEMAKRMTSGRTQTKKKKEDKIEKAPKRRDDASFAWKQTRKAGETTRKVNNKTYHWCEKHNAWTLHKSVDCRLEQDAPAQKPDSLSISQALVGAIEEEDEDIDASDEE
jgi:hypothetical protein